MADLNEVPRRTLDRVLVDLEVNPGRVFRNGGYREKWVFATVAAERAAEFAGAFDLFSETADLTNVRHYVLRPKATKVKIENLETAIRILAAEYNKHAGRLVTARLIAPLICVVHVRFDEKLGLFDLHMHAVWRVAADDLDRVLQGIQTKFSSTWVDQDKIRNVAALVNYLVTWVIDHRALPEWPDDAFLALWKLNRPKFIRPAGAFAGFRKSLRGFRIVREGNAATLVPIKKRNPRPSTASSKPRHGSTLCYVRAKVGGKERLCAIAAVDGEKRLTSRQVRDILDRSQFSRFAKPILPTTMTSPTPQRFRNGSSSAHTSTMTPAAVPPEAPIMVRAGVVQTVTPITTPATSNPGNVRGAWQRFGYHVKNLLRRALRWLL